MKIHYLIRTYEGGGAGFAMVPVLKQLRDAGHEIVITACHAGNMLAADRFEEAGFPCRTLFTERAHKLRLIWKLIKLIKKEGRPDIIMTSFTTGGYIGRIVGKLLSIPVVSWKHCAYAKKITTRTKNLCNFWITDSPSVSKFVKDDMKIRSDKIMTWPLFYCEVEKSNRPAWKGDTSLRIGSIGRLHDVKNYPILLDGIALFRKTYPEYSDKISVSILGEGRDRDKLENKIKEHGLEDYVTLLGYSPDIYNYLATLDLYVQPSEYEGMCMAAHEALSTGLPLMATPVGEMKTSIDHDTGFSLNGNIAEDISSHLKTIFDNPSILAKKSQNALNYMYKYYSKDAFEAHGKNVIKRMETLKKN